MSYNYRIGQNRGPNSVNASPRRMDSEDGLFAALGITVKGEGKTPGTWVPVEVWTLKAKIEGRWTVVDRRVSYERACEWVRGEVARG